MLGMGLALKEQPRTIACVALSAFLFLGCESCLTFGRGLVSCPTHFTASWRGCSSPSLGFAC